MSEEEGGAPAAAAAAADGGEEEVRGPEVTVVSSAKYEETCVFVEHFGPPETSPVHGEGECVALGGPGSVQSSPDASPLVSPAPAPASVPPSLGTDASPLVSPAPAPALPVPRIDASPLVSPAPAPAAVPPALVTGASDAMPLVSPAPALPVPRIGARGPLDPLLFLHVERPITLRKELDIDDSDALHEGRIQQLLSRAKAAAGNAAATWRLFEPMSARSSSEQQSQQGARSPAKPAPVLVELAEDEGMHERWSAVLGDRRADSVPEEELRWLVDTGTPLRYRHQAWPRWWREEQSNMELGDASSPLDEACERQIDCDLCRTLPERMRDSDRQALRRVLRAYASQKPEVGYCQGMSFLAAIPLLLGFTEQSALTCLCYITEDICPGYHGPALAGYFRDVAVLSALLSYLLPEIHGQLEALEMPLHMLATDHLLTLSTRIWPLPSVVRLWDVVLMEGSAALLASFLACMKMYFPDAAAAAAQTCRGLAQPADVASQFRDLECRCVAGDIDELVHQTRNYLPLVRGEPEPGGKRGAGCFLEWFRLQHDVAAADVA